MPQTTDTPKMPQIPPAAARALDPLIDRAVADHIADLGVQLAIAHAEREHLENQLRGMRGHLLTNSDRPAVNASSDWLHGYERGLETANLQAVRWLEMVGRLSGVKV